MAEGRSVLREILKGFINSFRPGRFRGDLVGIDYTGTKYYELPKTAHSTRLRDSRWFEPPVKDDFEHNIPPEWLAWLSHKRKNPPTEEEIQKNLLKARQVVENAKKLETPKSVKKEITVTSEKPAFPKYDDYETEPGIKPK